MNSEGPILLRDVAARTDTLKVACTQCERVARYRLESLIAQHGRRFGIPMLLRRLSEDCEKRSTVTAHDLCGVYCPDLPALFLGRSG